MRKSRTKKRIDEAPDSLSLPPVQPGEAGRIDQDPGSGHQGQEAGPTGQVEGVAARLDRSAESDDDAIQRCEAKSGKSKESSRSERESRAAKPRKPDSESDKIYNPLDIHDGDGLGMTNLAQVIDSLQQDPDKTQDVQFRVKAMSQWLGQLLKSLRGQRETIAKIQRSLDQGQPEKRDKLLLEILEKALESKKAESK